MNLRQCILTKNDCYKAGKKITPKGVMVHSTGANNPTLRRYVGPDDGLLGNNPNNNHWNRSGTGACVHAFIGKLKDGSIATYQTLPWNMRSWHGAKGKNGSCNDTHISFEICEDGLTDKAYFQAVYREAVELTAYLCELYSLDPLADGVVICHQEGYRRGIASNHGDVLHWWPKMGKSMDDFRADVAAELNKKEEPELTEKQVREIVRSELEKIEAERATEAVSSWAAKEFAEAKAAGITDGTRPLSAITRQEAAIMVLRGLGK